MNKQEAIEEINNLKGLNILDKTINFDSEMISKKEVLNIVKQLDEPVKPPEPKPLEIEKPVIPKYVADWIEWCKKHKITLLGSIIAVCNNKNIRTLDASGWATKNQETLTKAWLYGYEVEKEKLYTVELPNPNAGGHVVLCKTSDGIVSIFFTGMARWRGGKNFQLTEAEIKKDFDWAFRWAEEVEE